MSRSYANHEVLEFYRKLPFNYFGDVNASTDSIRESDSITYYPPLPPILQRGVKVIDIGCGAGGFVNAVNFHYGRYGTRACGVDYNPVALKQASLVASRLGITSDFVQADLFSFMPAEPFDLVTSLGVLHHTDDCMEGLRHVARHCLRQGGHLFVGLYHKHGRKPFLDHFARLREKGLNRDELFLEFMKLRASSGDRLHDYSWFCDQVLHPHETQHTLEEIIAVLRSERMKLISTSINRYQPFSSESDLIEQEKAYYQIGVRRLQERTYFPGFFVFLAAATQHQDSHEPDLD